MSEQYHIRPYESGDRSDFLDLYEQVHGERKSSAWFDWKYGANPFADDRPMIVAERDGELVGARPLFAIPIRRRGWEATARQPADAMVHGDHRRRGVFTRMIERAVDRCERQGVDFLFTFPNARSGGAYRKLGWDVVGDLTERFRVHRPVRLLAARRSIPAVPGLDAAAAHLVGASTIPASVGRPKSVDVETIVRQHTPVDELNRLYRRAEPNAIHTPRTKRFLDWRFENPDWTYRTFLGYHEGDLAGAIVTGTREIAEGARIARCIDVLPFAGSWRRAATLDVVLADVVDALDDIALFVLPGGHLPASVCARNGFWSDDAHPIDLVANPTLLFVHPLRDAAREGGVTDRNAWAPTFVEYDTA